MAERGREGEREKKEINPPIHLQIKRSVILKQIFFLATDDASSRKWSEKIIEVSFLEEIRI